MLYQIKGIIDDVYETETVSEKFNRRNFILRTQNIPEKWEYLKFELQQKRCLDIDDYKKGDAIIVWFQLQGNKWDKGDGITKFYNTFRVWKLEKDLNPQIWQLQFQIKGGIDEIHNTEKITENFNKRNFILLTQNTPERYEYLKFELHQKQCDNLNVYKKGDKIIVWFQLQGNKWNDNGITKFYNTFRVWKVEKDNST